MKFTERITRLREESQMPHRQFVAPLETDTATCKVLNIVKREDELLRTINEIIKNLGGALC
jgi:hypothetical protein